ncbi:MAG: T9SS type B sorting domain-containing protein, partial [Bacteroidia bacterium]
QGGLFTVKVSLTDVFGCKDSSSTTVTVYPKPVADFVYAPLKPHIYADDQVTFTNASYGANIVSYNWSFVTPAVILSSALNPVINYTKAGDYTCMLLVTSDHGCIDTISKPIEVNDDYNIFIPNAFTPNGDGINETFQPKGTGFSKYHMRIFDRWGELLYETDELGNGWDGTFQKKSKDVLPNDVYIYKIHLVTIYGESKDVLGHVSLIR